MNYLIPLTVCSLCCMTVGIVGGFVAGICADVNTISSMSIKIIMMILFGLGIIYILMKKIG